MKYKLEKDIPIPFAAHKRRKSLPFSKLKAGESVFFNLSDTEYLDLRSFASAIMQAVSHHKKRHGGEFTTRTLRDSNGIRVWRIK